MRLHDRVVLADTWSDTDLLQWHRDKREVYRGIWALAEPSGCLDDAPFSWKVLAWPSPLDADLTVERISQYRDELIEERKLIPYEVDGQRYLFIRSFLEHNKLKYQGRSSVPLPMWVTWEPFDSNPRSGRYQLNKESLQKCMGWFTRKKEAASNTPDVSEVSPRARREEKPREEEVKGSQVNEEEKAPAKSAVAGLPSDGIDWGELQPEDLQPEDVVLVDPPDALPDESGEPGAPDDEDCDTPKKRPPTYRQVLDAYHRCCPSLPKVKMLNDDRENKLRILARRLETIEAVEEYFCRIEASDFLAGRAPSNDRPDWRADIDYVLRPSALVRVMDGLHDNKPGRRGNVRRALDLVEQHEREEAGETV